MQWAFSDESERAQVLLGVLFVPVPAVRDSRKALHRLLLPGQRQVHTSDESARRRRLLIDVVAALDATAVVYAIRRQSNMNRVAARHVLLTAAAAEVLDREVASWTLDSQHEHQAAADRITLERSLRHSKAPLAYDHRPAASEPLLWAIDAVVWACGAGGDWRRRLDQVVDVRWLEP